MAGAIAPATAPRCPLSSRGPKPPASARPAPGGRFAPTGPGAGLRCSRTCRSTGHRPARAGKRAAFPDPPGLAQALSPLQWQGPSPRPQRHAAPCPAGGQSPRPAPAPPPAGASHPPGRALAAVGAGCTGPGGGVTRGRGKRGSRFLIPSEGAKALSPLQWQGPSPLPQRYIVIRTSRGPQPPASARPAPGGRFAPAGSGAGLSWCPDPPVCRAPSRTGGGNAGRVSCSRPDGRSRGCPVSLAGAVAPATAPRRSLARRGPKPPASTRPAPGGRWPLSVRVAPVLVAASRAGGRKQCVS